MKTQVWLRSSLGAGVLAAALLMSAGGCKKQCTSFVQLGNASVEIKQCWDNVDRTVRCQGSGSMSCECVAGGTVGKTFQRQDGLPMNLASDQRGLVEINKLCGWELQR